MLSSKQQRRGYSPEKLHGYTWSSPHLSKRLNLIPFLFHKKYIFPENHFCGPGWKKTNWRIWHSHGHSKAKKSREKWVLESLCKLIAEYDVGGEVIGETMFKAANDRMLRVGDTRNIKKENIS